ncbi:MAG: hypothetical protein HY533_04230 [Chloroflexi bacterium]|nr:hypothetical protein [Chloroflexota bacterium]
MQISLKPGQNLISLPRNPVDTAINEVIKDLTVRSVITYDPLNPDLVTGPWKTAARGTDGKFTGNLTSIDSNHGYWVNAKNFATVAIPLLGLRATPTTIALAAGWNLVPIVVKHAAPATLIPADSYFGGTSWVTAFTFNPQTNEWTRIVPESSMNVVVGKGYWLYVAEAGKLTVDSPLKKTISPWPVSSWWGWWFRDGRVKRAVGVFALALLLLYTLLPMFTFDAVPSDLSLPRFLVVGGTWEQYVLPVATLLIILLSPILRKLGPQGFELEPSSIPQPPQSGLDNEE